MSGLQSYEELQENLQNYVQQQDQVEQLLLLDPENEELRDMYDSLGEVIELTQDLLKDAQAQHAADAAAGGATAAAAGADMPSTSAPATAPGGGLTC